MITTFFLLFYYTGGSFGLWTGISLFTFVEFIYFAGINLKLWTFGRKEREENRSDERSFKADSINRGYIQDNQLEVINKQPIAEKCVWPVCCTYLRVFLCIVSCASRFKGHFESYHKMRVISLLFWLKKKIVWIIVWLMFRMFRFFND